MSQHTDAVLTPSMTLLRAVTLERDNARAEVRRYTIRIKLLEERLDNIIAVAEGRA